MQNTQFLLSNQPLFNCFLSIQDPRVPGRSTYPLINIIGIVLLGLLSGFDTWKGFEIFAHARRRWLSQFFDLSSGTPSHYTLARVFERLDPIELQTRLKEWFFYFYSLVPGDIVSIDGKTQRGSSHRIGGKKANHIVSAYCAKNEMMLDCMNTPSKSNEIKAIPVLLKMMNIKGLTVTIDAMGTQRGIANLIHKKQGFYMLALKKNHKRFYRKVENLFNAADACKYQSMVYKSDNTLDYGHGRIEKREYTILPSMYLPAYAKIWRGLKTFIRLESTRELANGEVEQSIRYYISSLPLKNYRKICFSIREHWQIENGLHYRLDVGFREDHCQVYRGNAAENLGIMRKFALKLLSDECSKLGIAEKRKKAAVSPCYLRKVVGF